MLIEKIAKTKKPVQPSRLLPPADRRSRIWTTWATSFTNRNIPLAVNHCVSQYPCEDRDLEMNQIDFLRTRYPHHTIGFSTHEYHDWTSSMLISSMPRARARSSGTSISTTTAGRSRPDRSLPDQVDTWFKAFHKAKEMCGAAGTQKRMAPRNEIEYLDSLVRGVYAKTDLPEGHIPSNEDVYLAIPLQQGQISCRELMRGEVLTRPLAADEAITIDFIAIAPTRAFPRCGNRSTSGGRHPNENDQHRERLLQRRGETSQELY